MTKKKYIAPRMRMAATETETPLLVGSFTGVNLGEDVDEGWVKGEQDWDDFGDSGYAGGDGGGIWANAW